MAEKAERVSNGWPWHAGDTLISNNGKGPLRARVLDVGGERIAIAWWNPRSAAARPQRKRATLLRRSVEARVYGWHKKRRAASPREEPER